MEVENSNQTELKSQNLIENQPFHKNILNQKGNFIIIVGVIVIIFIVGIIVYILGSRQSTGTTQAPVNPATNIQNNSIDYTIPILKEYDPSTFGRNLWLYSSDGTKSKQITSNHEIGSEFGFSPDKKRILVMTTKLLPSEKKVESNIGFVNLGNGQVTKLFQGFNEITTIYQAHWLDNDRIIYSLGRKLEIYNISTNSNEVLIDTEKTITDATQIRFTLSPNRQWIVYNYEGSGEGDPPQQDSNTYSLNLNNKIQKQLNSGPFRSLAINNNYVVFYKNTDRQGGTILWRINYDGSRDEQITKTPPEDLIRVVSTSMGDKLIYQVRNFSGEPKGAQLHLYDIETKQDSIFFSVKVPDGIRDPIVSDTGDTVLFSAALDENQPLKLSLILYNLKSNTKTILSDDALK